MFLEAIWNTRKEECFIRYQNTLKLVKKNSASISLFNPLLSVWISDETLVFDILLIIWNHNEHSLNLRFICTETSDWVQREGKTKQKEIPNSKKDHHQTTQQEQSGSNTSHSIVLTERNQDIETKWKSGTTERSADAALHKRPFAQWCHLVKPTTFPQANVVTRVDNTIHWMTQYSLHNSMDLGSTYPMETVIYPLDTTLY